MAIKIGLLSGKGGSGKTTVGLSIANLISDNEQKILYIDCDMATNGATYFFEKKYFPDELTLESIRKGYIENKHILQVNSFFDFIPTRTYFQGRNDEIKEKDSYFTQYIQSIDFEYDIIIFDCQAGYSDHLRSILKITDINLIVMELDTVSTSAVRVLYKQISDLLEAKPTYQIFNKISPEEREIYQKVTTGTIFTALPPILFSYNIRRYFAYGKIPETSQKNIKFSMSIYDILKIILNDYVVDWYHQRFLENIVSPEKVELEKRRSYLKSKKSRKLEDGKTKNIWIEWGSMIMMVLFLGIFVTNIYLDSMLTNILLIVSMIFYMVYTQFLCRRLKEHNTNHVNIQVDEIEKEIKECEERLQSYAKYF